MKVAITGGHHTSALPVIKELNRRFPDVRIVWFGHKYSMLGDKSPTLEFREIKSLGIEFFDLKAGKVYKTYNLKRLLKVPFGFFQAFYFLLKERPDVILSFGGYLAPPVVLAGWFLRIPSLTHEQTVVSGYANKLVSRFAEKILISWPQSEKYYPKDKTIFTGLPLRSEIFELKSNSFRINESLPTVYISSGKQGSHKINMIVKEGMGEILSFCNIIHQCGGHSLYNDYDQLLKKYSSCKGSLGKYFARKFVLSNEIGEAFAKSNLVVGRAGAHFISEILALRKPAILIPIPWASHNEQMKNASLLVDYEIGRILKERDLSRKSFVDLVRSSLDDLDRFNLKGGREEIFPKLNAAKLIVDEVLESAGGKN